MFRIFKLPPFDLKREQILNKYFDIMEIDIFIFSNNRLDTAFLGIPYNTLVLLNGTK